MRSNAAGRRPARLLCRVIAMALCLAPAVAGARPDLRWDIPLDPAQGPSELRLDRCDDGCFARVSFLNRHLHGPALARRFTLDLQGLEVLVTVEDGALREPERFTVIPPPGFTAEPATLAVDEDATGVIALVPLPMS